MLLNPHRYKLYYININIACNRIKTVSKLSFETILERGFAL